MKKNQPKTNSNFDENLPNDIDSLSKKINLSKHQIDSIISKPQGITTINFLIDNYTILKKLLNYPNSRYDSSKSLASVEIHELLFKMANHKSGHLSLKGFIEYHQSLVSHFTPKQIALIVSYTGGSCNLEVISANINQLTAVDFKFSKEEIVKIASCQGGGRKIQDLLDNYHTLLKNKSPKKIYEYYKQLGKKRASILLNTEYLKNQISEVNEQPAINIAHDCPSDANLEAQYLQKNINTASHHREVGFFSNNNPLLNLKRKSSDDTNSDIQNKRRREIPEPLCNYAIEYSTEQLNDTDNISITSALFSLFSDNYEITTNERDLDSFELFPDLDCQADEIYCESSHFCTH